MSEELHSPLDTADLGDLPAIRLLIEHDDQPGARNMAVDECLLEAALERGQSSVRIYGWDQATVSLGYFQPPSDPERERRFAGLPTVRRLSGGGAILHHLEVTYSFALSPQHPLAQAPSVLYARAHNAVLNVLRGCGVEARMRGADLQNDVEPFLCFSRGDKNDIVLGAIKIVGSAQRRRRGAVLQHGSLILRQSPFAAEVPGLLDLAPTCNVPSDLRSRLGQALAAVLGSSIDRAPLTADEATRVQELIETRYSHLNWGRTEAAP